MNGIEWIVDHMGSVPARALWTPTENPTGRRNAIPIGTRLEILRMLALGLSNGQIAERVGLGESVVQYIAKKHRKLNEDE